MSETIITTAIKDLLVIQRPIYPDDRGSFQELVKLTDLEEAIGRPVSLRQLSIARTVPKGFRGIHAEDQDKIICPIDGRIFAAFVDIRPDSPSFRRVETMELGPDESNKNTTIFLPTGVGNSLCVISAEPVKYLYSITKEYDPNLIKRQFSGNDPSLAIQWPYPWEEMIMSEADRNNKTLQEVLGK